MHKLTPEHYSIAIEHSEEKLFRSGFVERMEADIKSGANNQRVKKKRKWIKSDKFIDGSNRAYMPRKKKEW